jgi:hypothetical protein
VRYDKNVPAGAKLLYGEISTLCNKEGYCWAGNAHFAELYQTSERTIINWINALAAAGHITVRFNYVPGKKEVQSRILRLTEAILSKITQRNKDEKAEPSEDEPEKQREVVKNSSPPMKKDSPRGEKNFTTYGKNFHEVVKNPSKGGEKNFMDNTTSNNTNNNTTTTTASGPPETDGEPPPAVEKAAVAAALSPYVLKTALSALDHRLLFDEDFYPMAAYFMAERGLGQEYMSWLREYCENTDYYSFGGLYFSLFFKDSMVEKYKLSLSENLPSSSKQPSQPAVCVCEACGTTYDRAYEKCLSCGLPEGSPPNMVSLYRELYGLPAETREEYLQREKSVYEECGFNFEKLNPALAALKREYGLTVSL